MDRCYPQKLERGILPSIDKNKATDFDTVPWKKQPVKPPPRSAPCKKVGRGDITPWVGDSPLDSPFGAIPQSLELHHAHAGSRCCLLYSHSIDPKEESNIVGSGQVGMGSNGPKEVEALTQRSGREDQSRRKPIGKAQAGGKLPPVQSISNLNFSRNFTFSFFQLPPHQLQRYQARSTHVR